MAPIATNTAAQSPAPLKDTSNDTTLKWFQETGVPESEYPYSEYLPHWAPADKQGPLTEFQHVDPGLKALQDPSPQSFLDGADVDMITPRLGSEVSGIQLSKLDERGRQQLALFVAQRGVVAFRDQDFMDQPAEWFGDDWTAFFGRPHLHPVSGAPKDVPFFHLVHRVQGSKFNYTIPNRATTTGWHSDVTFELQPPGLTTLFLFDSPPSGGDTGYIDQRSTYNRLSPSFREYLETLSVVHSGREQVQYVMDRFPEFVKRDPIETVHPLVRRHPVTGEKALFINRVFCRSIVGLKKEESEALLSFLYNHMEVGQESQCRVRWRPRSVVIWDNRILAHTAILDFDHLTGRRHGARLTPQAEKPFL